MNYLNMGNLHIYHFCPNIFSRLTLFIFKKILNSLTWKLVFYVSQYLPRS